MVWLSVVGARVFHKPAIHNSRVYVDHDFDLVGIAQDREDMENISRPITTHLYLNE